MGCFIEVLRAILCCADECDYGKENENPERNPLLESLSRPTYATRSSHAYSDPLSQHDSTIRYSNDDYTDFIKSQLTRKIDARSFQPWGRSQDLKRSTPAASRYPCSQSCSSPKLSQSSLEKNPSYSKPSLSSSSTYSPVSNPTTSYQNIWSDKLPTSSLKPPLSSSTTYLPVSSSTTSYQNLLSDKQPSSYLKSSLSSTKASLSSSTTYLPVSNSTTSYQNLSSDKLLASSLRPSLTSAKATLSAQSSSLKTLSSVAVDNFTSTNKKKKEKHAWVPRNTSSGYMVPRVIENSIKNEIGPEVLKKPLALSTNKNYFEKGNKAKYARLSEKTSSIFMIPKAIENSIKNEIVPKVLKKPLSLSTYKDYFAVLLYAEDYYIEKWCEFLLRSIRLELHKASIYGKPSKRNNFIEDVEEDDKLFVAFKVDSIPEKRPYLLSRDFAFAKPFGSNKKFQGAVRGVVKNTTVLVEFGKDFHSQHCSTKKYDVNFSFNRVCLKRAHEAISIASNPLLRNFIIPRCISRRVISTPKILSSNPELDVLQRSAIFQILSIHGPPPYLVAGPLCLSNMQPWEMGYDDDDNDRILLSRTGMFICEAVVQIHKTIPESRILICTPTNNMCDILVKSLRKNIPESEIFRANAAFRDKDEVPEDILPYCPYEGECFVCPPLEELKNYKVVLSTYVSSFRLHSKGIRAGHFSHIFLVDASSVIEPEAIVVLAHLATESSVVVVTGGAMNCPRWVRSTIARNHGLCVSYFQRLYNSEQYSNADSGFITEL